MKALQGKVSTHAMTMRSPQIQRTERTPLVVPTPRIEPVMAWVVEIGTPRRVAAMIVKAAAVSAQKPPTGWSLVMPEPMVLTMRQPPNIVPMAIAKWHTRMIHHATLWVWPKKLSELAQECGSGVAH